MGNILNTLKKCSFDNTFLIMDEQLERKEYELLKTFLSDYDIKWNSSKKCFKGKKSEIKKMKDYCNGKIKKPISKRRDNHFYPTPFQILEYIKEDLGIGSLMFNNMKFLEPSAGNGNIANFFKGNFIDENITLVELDSEMALKLRDNYKNVICNDFLKFEPNEKFDFIIMNPPFQGNAYLKHVLHAYSLLAKGGILKAIIPTSVFKNNSKLHIKLRNLMAIHGSGYSQIFKEAFEHTKIDVVVIELKKSDIVLDTIDLFVMEFTNSRNYGNNVNKKNVGRKVSDKISRVEEYGKMEEDRSGDYFGSVFSTELEKEYLAEIEKYYDLYVPENLFDFA